MRSPVRILMLAAALFATPLAAARTHAAAADSATVRVGIIAFEGQFDDWRSMLGQFERESRTPLHFELALGTYGELLHWMEQGWIDVAVLSPSLFAFSRDADQYPRAAAAFDYLATIGYQVPSVSRDGARSADVYRHEYGSVCVVSKDSPLKTIEDVREAHRKGELYFLFGHPLSTSSRIAPERALRAIGIEPDPERIEYAQSHTNILYALAQYDPAHERVAFVYNGALPSNEALAASVRVIQFPELDRIELPWDVVVGRRNNEGVETLRKAFLRYRDAAGEKRFRHLDDWQTRYDAIGRWADEIGLDWNRRGGMEMSLEEIGSYLEHCRRSQPHPPRLAVVLSGGGARCSYQVGAMAALEEELRRLNQRDADNHFDIDLVVGTSGGAINALPVALGITATPAGMSDFASVWTSLDQREIIQLAPILRVSIGLWLGILRITILVILLKLVVRRQSRRAWWLGAILMTMALLEGVVGWRMSVPWSWLGDDHVRHHLWLWMSQGHNASIVLIAVVGAGVLAAQAVAVRRGTWLRLSPPVLAVMVAFCLVVLPLVTWHHLLVGEETLSRGKGLERAMADGMSLMVGNQAERLTGEPLEFSSTAPTERLREVSRDILDRGLLRRDLIVTASCIEQSRPLLPDDLYFYQRAHTTGGSTPLGHRGVPLDRLPERMIEVVLGSGSIFPLFPGRRLDDFPEPGEYVVLVDGGFAHNSPIEAAVLWGATHIILIEASPPRSGTGKGLAANIVAAAQHYARQTEQVDRRSSKEVVVFTLSPEEPHPCLLDFSDNLIRATINKGYRDASGLAGDDPGSVPDRRFVKQPGKPVFVQVTPGAVSRGGAR